MKLLKIYTDGGMESDIGASAFVIIDGKDTVIVESVVTSESDLDNNRFELMAIINALNWLRSNNFSPKKYRIYVYTDSQSAQLGICEKTRIWKANNWKSANKKELESKKLWMYLDNLICTEFTSLHVQWQSKSSQNKFQQRADELCTIAMKNFKNSKIEVK